jgi:hypothetical protein
MDSSFIMGAISGIHQANYNDAQREVHLGTGTVILDCSRYQDEYAIPISSENKI